jgi:hypothetical protein
MTERRGTYVSALGEAYCSPFTGGLLYALHRNRDPPLGCVEFDITATTQASRKTVTAETLCYQPYDRYIFGSFTLYCDQARGIVVPDLNLGVQLNGNVCQIAGYMGLKTDQDLS